MVEVEKVEKLSESSDAESTPHVCEPQLLRLKSGALILTHRVGTGRATDDGTPKLLRSTDHGETWTPLGTPFAASTPRGWDIRRASMTELRPGVILAALLGIDKSDGRPLYNPITEGCLPVHSLYARSNDAGVSWTEPWHLAPAAASQLSAQALVTLADGAVLCTFERFKEYSDPEPWRYQVNCMRSTDDGRTWRDLSTAAASDNERDPEDTMWWDPRIARLDDGRLIQFYYAYRHRTGTEGPTHVAWSNDDGYSWTPPTPTTLRGQATYPIPLKGGGILVFQQRRTNPQTMVACFSRDGGETFRTEDEVVVYEHLEDSAPAADGRLEPTQYLQSMDSFTFGHPTGVELDPDKVLVAWYAGGFEQTAIWAATLRINRRSRGATSTQTRHAAGA